SRCWPISSSPTKTIKWLRYLVAFWAVLGSIKFGREDSMALKLKFRNPTTRQMKRELKKKLPELKKRLEALERAKTISPETRHLIFR
ncbi:MAG: hypothetical protein AAB672_00880, partial [Patescibacteria group bacterium]